MFGQDRLDEIGLNYTHYAVQDGVIAQYADLVKGLGGEGMGSRPQAVAAFRILHQALEQEPKHLDALRLKINQINGNNDSDLLFYAASTGIPDDVAARMLIGKNLMAGKGFKGANPGEYFSGSGVKLPDQINSVVGNTYRDMPNAKRLHTAAAYYLAAAMQNDGEDVDPEKVIAAAGRPILKYNGGTFLGSQYGQTQGDAERFLYNMTDDEMGRFKKAGAPIGTPVSRDGEPLSWEQISRHGQLVSMSIPGTYWVQFDGIPNSYIKDKDTGKALRFRMKDLIDQGYIPEDRGIHRFLGMEISTKQYGEVLRTVGSAAPEGYR
jgi:hypothetical protein